MPHACVVQPLMASCLCCAACDDLMPVLCRLAQGQGHLPAPHSQIQPQAHPNAQGQGIRQRRQGGIQWLLELKDQPGALAAVETALQVRLAFYYKASQVWACELRSGILF